MVSLTNAETESMGAYQGADEPVPLLKVVSETSTSAADACSL
jgi:hypothetical protein